jgi:hypothetical protein
VSPAPSADASADPARAAAAATQPDCELDAGPGPRRHTLLRFPDACHRVQRRGGALAQPGVAGIGTASFLADAGHEIPTALLPSLLTSTLGVSPVTMSRRSRCPVAAAASRRQLSAVRCAWRAPMEAASENGHEHHRRHADRARQGDEHGWELGHRLLLTHDYCSQCEGLMGGTRRPA